MTHASPNNVTGDFFLQKLNLQEGVSRQSAVEIYGKCILVTQTIFEHFFRILDDKSDLVEAGFTDLSARALTLEIEVGFAASLENACVDHELASLLATRTVRAIGKELYWSHATGLENGATSIADVYIRHTKQLLDDQILEKTRRRLTAYVGDWKDATPTELAIVRDLVDCEDDLLTVRSALAGQIEAESCFR